MHAVVWTPLLTSLAPGAGFFPLVAIPAQLLVPLLCVEGGDCRRMQADCEGTHDCASSRDGSCHSVEKENFLKSACNECNTSSKEGVDRRR